MCKVRVRSGEENIKERGVPCVEEVMWETGLVKNIIKQVRDHTRWRTSNDVDVPGGRGVCQGDPPIAQV